MSTVRGGLFLIFFIFYACLVLDSLRGFAVYTKIDLVTFYLFL